MLIMIFFHLEITKLKPSTKQSIKKQQIIRIPIKAKEKTIIKAKSIKFKTKGTNKSDILSHLISSSKNHKLLSAFLTQAPVLIIMKTSIINFTNIIREKTVLQIKTPIRNIDNNNLILP